MATGLSGLAEAYHPQLTKLRQQLEGLVPERAATLAKEAVASPSTLFDRISANAPLLMELGSSLLKRMTRSSEQVMEAAAIERKPRFWIRRIGYVKSALAITVALGAAYLIGRSHRPVASRSARATGPTGRSRADMA